MGDLNRLSQIAAQLVGRVREDDPEANGRWLLAMTTDEERWALLWILAAAVPVDQTWSQLTAWAGVDPTEEMVQRRRRQWREADCRRRERAA